METAGTVCGVVDGAAWCQGFLDVQRPDAVRILDFPHPVGSLATIAQVGFGEGTPAATAWLEAQRHALRHDAPEAVLAASRAVRDPVAGRPDATAPGGPVAVLDQRLAYLEQRADQLRYATFVAQGSPIGSGIVESANKLVVEARLKGAEMHWAPQHVNPLLALRGVACSDRWEEAWPLIVPQVLAQQRAVAAQRRVARRAAPRPLAPPSPPRVATAVASAPPGEPPAERPAVAPGGGAAAGTAPPAPRVPAPRRPAANHPWRRPAILPKGGVAPAWRPDANGCRPPPRGRTPRPASALR